MKQVGILSCALLLVLAQTADATVVVQHLGTTNSGTEGFTNDFGGPVYGSPVSPPPAWNMTGPWNTNYDQYALSAAQEASLISENWRLTAIMQNLSTGVGNQTGIYSDVIIGDQRYDIDLQSDGAGNQVLSTNAYTGSPMQTYTIAGLGTNYATFVMTYDAATKQVDYYVNGGLAISDWPGFSEASAPIVFFGGVAGNFQVVSLATSIPELSTWAMMLAGFAGLGLAVYRASRRSAAIAA